MERPACPISDSPASKVLHPGLAQERQELITSGRTMLPGTFPCQRRVALLNGGDDGTVLAH